ncbi:MAG: Unknown protein [uncultured Aureispira sp.]|uniref:Uncharacterized protein n=1 Tax=uncultured Aureispira sp. TaxID=1331704 RepID=A0A6S6T2G6_9BACT|nr:MAG: Unknown protein [uncultured Aureispira sp.]
MSDILDDYKNGSHFTDHLYLQAYQVDAVVEKLKEYEIPHQVRPSKNLDDIGFVPLPATTKLNRPDFVVQIPNNLHFQVDQILEEQPELLHVSEDVRTSFLSSSMDKNGWLEILIYPEEWEDGDPAIAQKLLAQEGIQVTPALLAEQKEFVDQTRAENSEKTGLSFVQMLFITLFLLFTILGVLNLSSII